MQPKSIAAAIVSPHLADLHIRYILGKFSQIVNNYLWKLSSIESPYLADLHIRYFGQICSNCEQLFTEIKLS